MKHISFALLTAISAIICCSCSANTVWNGSSEANFLKTSENTTDIDLLTTEANLPSEADENRPQTFTENFDGIVMTVKTDKSIYKLDELIYVEAAVKNTTNEKINLYVPCLGPDSHQEICTSIYCNNGRLIDIDTFMKGFDDAVDIVTVDPGEEYIQSMRFETYTGCDTSSRKLAETGLHSGKCTISVLSDPTPNSDTTSYSLKFSLTLI